MFCRGDDVALPEVLRCRHGAVLVYGDQDRAGERQPGQVRHRPGLGGGEQQGLSASRQAGHDAVDRRGEAEVQTAVSLVQDEELEAVHGEGGVLVQVLEESAGCADQNVAAAHSRPFELEILPTNDQTRTEVVLAANSSENLKNLISQLSGRSDDQSSHTIAMTPLGTEQFLQQRNQKCQGFA